MRFQRRKPLSGRWGRLGFRLLSGAVLGWLVLPPVCGAQTQDWPGLRARLGENTAKMVFKREIGGLTTLQMLDVADPSPTPKRVSHLSGIDIHGPQISPDGRHVAYAALGTIYVSSCIPDAPASDLRVIGPGTAPHWWVKPGTREHYLLFGRPDNKIWIQKLDAYLRPQGAAKVLVSGNAISGRSLDGKYVAGDKANPNIQELSSAEGTENLTVVKSYRISSDGYCQSSFSPVTAPASPYFETVMFNDIKHDRAIVKKFKTDQLVTEIPNPHESGQTGYMPEWSNHQDWGAFMTRESRNAYLFSVPDKKVFLLVKGGVEHPDAWVGKSDPGRLTAVISAASLRGPAPFNLELDASRSQGAGLEHTWDFGGGKTAKGPKVSHTFSAKGSFPVRLLVRNPHGADSALVMVEVVDVGQMPILLSGGRPVSARLNSSDPKNRNNAFIASLPLLTDGQEGNMAKYYPSPVKDFWVGIDLGKVQPVHMVVATWMVAAYSPSYRILVSADSSQWIQFGAVRQGTGKIDTLRGSAQARYVRLALDTLVSRGEFQLRELAFFRFATGDERLPVALNVTPPGPLLLLPGNKVQLTAAVADQYGATMESAKIDFVVQGKGGSKMAADGTLEAGTGKGLTDTVVVRAGALETRLLVRIAPDPIVFQVPLDGKIFRTGDTLAIRWESDRDQVTDVFFHLSVNDGRTWMTVPMNGSISVDSPDWGHYRFVLPSSLQGKPLRGDSCRIRIQDYTNPIQAVSGRFSIRAAGDVGMVPGSGMAPGIAVERTAAGDFRIYLREKGRHTLTLSDLRGRLRLRVRVEGGGIYRLPGFGLAPCAGLLRVEGPGVRADFYRP